MHQRTDLNQRTRRWPPRIDEFVPDRPELREIVEIHQVDGQFDHVAPLRPGGGEGGADVPEDLARIPATTKTGCRGGTGRDVRGGSQ